MAFTRPTLDQLITRTKTDLEARLNGGNPVLRRAFIAVIARVIAGAAHLLYGFLDYIFLQAFPDTAEDEYLLRWASIYGVSRKVAEFAEGDVVFTGTNGTIIPALTQVQRADGVVFETEIQVTIASGEATVNAIAVEAGVDGNTDPATVMTLVSPISGVDNEVTVDTGGLVGGVEEESIDDLRLRLLARIRQPPQGGNADDFETWALEVPGVTRAWVYPLALGPGEVSIFFVRDDDTPSIIPDAGEVQAVQDYIDARRPVTATATVVAPIDSPLNFNIELLTVDTPEIRAAVEAELADLLRRESEPGGTIPLSHINEAISIAAGEYDHDLNSPSADVVATSGQLKTMGTVTWV
jgi:uncharacterized phage protein gp47/JayE